MKEQIIRLWFHSPDSSFAEVLARTLGPGYEICQGGLDSIQSIPLQRPEVDAILLDASATGLEAYDDILQAVRSLLETSSAPPPVIAMVHDDEQDVVCTFIENGVYETLASPPDIRELRLVLRRAHRYHQIELDLTRSRSRQQPSGQLGDLVGCSESIQQVFGVARKVAACDVSVLIMGETGTGKELLARAIHQLSPRAAGPFVPFSCANLPETLIDDELFGHEKGAFTGAFSARKGRFEAADKGTVFLDEIGDLAPGLQAKLLRVLQERSFERLGSSTTLNTDVRIVCATHQNLEEMVQDGRFRMDLYFRLNVVQLRVPPLRERQEDIPLLAHKFMGQYAQQFGKPTRRMSQPAMHALEEYSWPGNVRELENVIQRAVVLTEGDSIEPVHLPEKIHNGFIRSSASSLYEGEVQEFKRRLLVRSLRRCRGNRTETARLMGVTRGCLHRLINQFSLHEQEDHCVSLSDGHEMHDSPVVLEHQ
jgi:DNA-binding NtrC family response regulator